jgi:hypothetical protein
LISSNENHSIFTNVYSKFMDIPIIRNKWLGTYIFTNTDLYDTPDTGGQVINNDQKKASEVFWQFVPSLQIDLIVVWHWRSLLRAKFQAFLTCPQVRNVCFSNSIRLLKDSVRSLDPRTHKLNEECHNEIYSLDAQTHGL